MFSKSKTGMLILILSFLLLLAGSTYFLYLQVMFPQLVPHYGSRERFTFGKANNYTFQIPWSAHTILHLSLQTNNTVNMYVDSAYMCNCTQYDFAIEQGEQALILLKSESPVSGMFKAWQEIPLERQLLALTLLSIGFIGIKISIRIFRKKGSNL